MDIYYSYKLNIKSIGKLKVKRPKEKIYWKKSSFLKNTRVSITKNVSCKKQSSWHPHSCYNVLSVNAHSKGHGAYCPKDTILNISFKKYEHINIIEIFKQTCSIVKFFCTSWRWLFSIWTRMKVLGLMIIYSVSILYDIQFYYMLTTVIIFN